MFNEGVNYESNSLGTLYASFLSQTYWETELLASWFKVQHVLVSVAVHVASLTHTAKS